MIQVFRCQICGDPYIGEDKPSRCPFCGATEKFFVLASAWEDPRFELEEQSRKDLETALQLEVGNTAFYICARDKASDLIGKQLFKALAKIEAEHANAIRKLLGKDSLPTIAQDCAEDYKSNIENAHERESRAINFYKQAEARAQDPWIKTFFGALVEIESDHLSLHERAMENKL